VRTLSWRWGQANATPGPNIRSYPTSLAIPCDPFVDQGRMWWIADTLL
jgi:hypothetical protein